MMVKTLLSAALLFAALAAPAGLARSGTAADTSLVSVKPASGRDAAMKLAAQDAASVADEACRQQEQGGIDGVLRRLQPAGGYGHGHCLQPPSVAEAEATWRKRLAGQPPAQQIATIKRYIKTLKDHCDFDSRAAFCSPDGCEQEQGRQDDECDAISNILFDLDPRAYIQCAGGPKLAEQQCTHAFEMTTSSLAPQAP